MSANSNNKTVLDAVDAKMTALDTAIGKLDDLVKKRTALGESVADLKKQETEHLRNDDADENAVVESLTTLRARVDVQTARANSLDEQIKEQKAATVALGNTVGSVAHTLFMQLTANRKNRATAIFDSNFLMPHAATFPKSLLIDGSKLVVEIANLSPRFNAFHVPTDNRIEQLRHFAKEYVPLREHLLAEPDLVLAPVHTPSLSVVDKAA
jgi:chorismate mutase